MATASARGAKKSTKPDRDTGAGAGVCAEADAGAGASGATNTAIRTGAGAGVGGATTTDIKTGADAGAAAVGGAGGATTKWQAQERVRETVAVPGAGARALQGRQNTHSGTCVAGLTMTTRGAQGQTGRPRNTEAGRGSRECVEHKEGKRGRSRGDQHTERCQTREHYSEANYNESARDQQRSRAVR